MKPTLAVIVVPLLAQTPAAAAGATSAGGGALALAALVGAHEPGLAAPQRLALADMLNGRLNFAYNALCNGTCLQDIELRRNDENFLNALGTRRIPDPTTAGDFCRRFTRPELFTLIDIFNETRLNVWGKQPDDFFTCATIDMDGTMAETTGECKHGMDISYDGVWGYHPLVVTLAHTGEPLFLARVADPATS